MAHSYVCCFTHLVFSTKERVGLLAPEVRERLFPYLGGIARENGFSALCVGGAQDHVHMLLSLPATITLARAVQLLKGGSSKWLCETYPGRPFEWQEGYGAFSVSVSMIDATKAYIENQVEHHKKKTFAEEFTEFLKRHNIDYDPRFVLG